MREMPGADFAIAVLNDEKNQKNSLDSRSIWSIFPHIEIWSKARFSPSLDLWTFRFAN